MFNYSPDIIPDQFNLSMGQPNVYNGYFPSDPEIRNAVMKLQDLSKDPSLSPYEKQRMVFEVIKACPNVRDLLEFIERSKSARNHLIEDQDDTKRALDGLECKLKNTCISSNKE